jgi:DNA primase
MPTLDFQEIKAANPIEKVAKTLGLELKKSGHQLRGQCPSGAEGDRKFVITPSKGLWYSFALQKGGDVLALVQLVNDCSAKEAAQFLAGDTSPLEKTKKSSPEKSSGSERGFKPLDYLEPDHEAVDAVGFPPDVADAVGIGHAPRGILRGQVAVPIRLPCGQLIGYVGITEATLPPKWSI